MKKAITITYILIAAVVFAKAAIAYLTKTPLSNFDIAEMAAAVGILVAIPVPIAITALKHRAARKFLKHQAEKSRLDDTVDRVDDLEYKLDVLDDRIDDLQAQHDDSLAPDLFVPVINYTDTDTSKIVPLYELPPVNSIDSALTLARVSINARAREGMPVNKPVITIRNAYSV